MPNPHFETGFLWLVPWDPIYTPFTREEVLNLVFAAGQDVNSSIRISASPSWVHPEDPLNRVQHYNFWDVLQESLNRRLLISKCRSSADANRVAEFIDLISRTIDQASEKSSLSSSIEAPLTCAARIHQVLLGIEASSIVLNSSCVQRRRNSRHQGVEILAVLLQEALALILRVEVLLYNYHSRVRTHNQ